MFSKKQKRTPYEIGRDGSVDELRAALKNINVFDAKNAGAAYEARRGAVDAFLQGQPEKVAALLADPDSFATSREYGANASLRDVLACLAADPAQADARIASAYEQVPEELRQKALDEALLIHIYRTTAATPAVIEGLLSAGADVHQAPKGRILARAVAEGLPVAIIQTLLVKGAIFRDALFYAAEQRWPDDKIARIQTYQEQLTDENAANARQLAEQLKTLTEELRTLFAAVQDKKKKPKFKASRHHPRISLKAFKKQ